MKGYIKITVKEHDEDGLQVQAECNLEHVNIVDKIMLLGSFAEALEMDDFDLIAAAHTRPQAKKYFSKYFSKESIAIDTGAIENFTKGDQG